MSVYRNIMNQSCLPLTSSTKYWLVYLSLGIGHGMFSLELRKYLNSLLGHYNWNFQVLIKKSEKAKSAKIKIREYINMWWHFNTHQTGPTSVHTYVHSTRVTTINQENMFLDYFIIHSDTIETCIEIKLYIFNLKGRNQQRT